MNGSSQCARAPLVAAALPLSGVLDSYIELFRDGDLLQAERIEVQAAARALLLSDQFDMHPELLAEETARIERQQAPA